MIRAFALAATELFEPRFRRVVLLGVGVTLAAFLVLWAAIGWAVANTSFFQQFWLDAVVDALGVAAALVLSWFLFPAAAMVAVGMFTDGLIAAVERAHYPDLPPTGDVPFATQLAVGVKYGALTLVLKLLVLPLYLFAGIGYFLSLGIDGYLVGRGCFELVALRRLEAPAAKALRRAKALQVFLAGVAIAFLMTVPLVNLLAPALAVVVMLHRFETWRRSLGG